LVVRRGVVRNALRRFCSRIGGLSGDFGSDKRSEVTAHTGPDIFAPVQGGHRPINYSVTIREDPKLQPLPLQSKYTTPLPVLLKICERPMVWTFSDAQGSNIHAWTLFPSLPRFSAA
jgi:hypothetical protein